MLPGTKIVLMKLVQPCYVSLSVEKADQMGFSIIDLPIFDLSKFWTVFFLHIWSIC